MLLILIFMRFFCISSLLANNNLTSKEYLIKYDKVIERDRILIENNLHVLFCNQIPKGEICPLSGGKSGDSLYLGKFETKKFVIRIMAEVNSKTFNKQLSYSQLASLIKLGPSVLHYNEEDGIFITEFIEGMPLLPTLLENENILLQLSDALRNIHSSDVFVKDKYDLFELMQIKLNSLIQEHKCEYLLLEKYLDYIQNINFAIKRRNLSPRPCHNDIHMSNVFYDLDQNIKFIDWGDAGLGDPFFDLARASIEFHLSKSQTEIFINKYFYGNVSLVDRAHFVLMQQLTLFKIGLYFVDLLDLDEATKESVVSYLKKNEIEVIVNDIHSPQDVAKIIFNLFESRMSSEESKQALLTLNQL